VWILGPDLSIFCARAYIIFGFWRGRRKGRHDEESWCTSSQGVRCRMRTWRASTGNCGTNA
jgi:hypothetical protein